MDKQVNLSVNEIVFMIECVTPIIEQKEMLKVKYDGCVINKIFLNDILQIAIIKEISIRNGILTVNGLKFCDVNKFCVRDCDGDYIMNIDKFIDEVTQFRNAMFKKINKLSPLNLSLYTQYRDYYKL